MQFDIVRIGAQMYKKLKQCYAKRWLRDEQKSSWWSDLRCTDFSRKWLMENQVKLSCFSPVSVHLEILLQLFWPLLDKISQDLTREAAAEAGRLYNYTKRAFTEENYQSETVFSCWSVRGLWYAFVCQIWYSRFIGLIATPSLLNQQIQQGTPNTYDQTSNT